MKAIVITALVAGGAAAGALAQPKVATYQVRFGNNTNAITLAPGQSTQVTVQVAFEPGIGGSVTTGPLTGQVLGLSDGGFNLTAIETTGVAASWSNRLLDPPYSYPVWTSAGTLSGLSVNGVGWGMGFLLVPPHPQPLNPDAVWKGTLTIGLASGNGTIELTAAPATSTSVYAFSGASPFSFVSPYDDAPGTGTVTVWCYADCNQDGTLSVADFGCFQTRWVQGDPYADCNGSTTLTVADFGCYQTRFVTGCP